MSESVKYNLVRKRSRKTKKNIQKLYIFPRLFSVFFITKTSVAIYKKCVWVVLLYFQTFLCVTGECVTPFIHLLCNFFWVLSVTVAAPKCTKLSAPNHQCIVYAYSHINGRRIQNVKGFFFLVNGLRRYLPNGLSVKARD